MKKQLLLLVMTLLPMVAWSQSEPYAVLSSDGQTVTFYYDTQKASRGGIDINNSVIMYDSNSPYETATTAVFDASFADYRPVSTAYWFMSCYSLTNIVDIKNLNTSNVTNMDCMFFGCRGLTSLDVSGFDTSNVMRMDGMFGSCSGLTSLDLSGFNTSNVRNMGFMLGNCSGLTSLDLSGFNTSNVRNMEYMFYGCSGLASLDVSSFDTSNVTRMYNMFSSCSGLTTIYADEAKWSTASLTVSGDMFFGCTSLIGGNGTIYDGSYTNAEYARIDKPGQPGYLTQKKSGTGIYDVERGTLNVERYFTLDGRKVDGVPAKKGMYIVNGRKVAIK